MAISPEQINPNAGLVQEIFPWLQAVWQGLQQQQAQQRLPHALLINGQRGVGKRELARALAHGALCQHGSEDGTGLACGHCASCELLRAGSHPDYREIVPEEDSKVIKVDAIRELIDYVSLKTQFGGSRFLLLHPAQDLYPNAANALLKTLEEPAPGTVLILIAEQVSRLPATIRSRCQLLGVACPPVDEAAAWLATQSLADDQGRLLLNLAQGSPLLAKAMAGEDDIVQRQQCFADWADVALGRLGALQLAQQWFSVWSGNKKNPGHAGGLERPLQWLLSWLEDLIRLHSGAGPESLLNSDLQTRLQPLAQQLDLDTVFKRRDDVLLAIQHLNSNLNEQLMLEELFVPWSRNKSGHNRRSMSS